MDQDSAFISSLMNDLLRKFEIKIKTVVPGNHQSLQAEHRIKSLSNILTKHFTNMGQMCPKYLTLATFAYNMFNTPTLGNHSPYGLYKTKIIVKSGVKLLISRSQAASKNIMTY